MKIFNAFTGNLKIRLKRMRARINKSVFVGREILKSAFSPKPKLNILFSVKPAWEPNIRIGFRPTRHHLLFDAFTDENIEKSDLAVPLTMKDLKYLSVHHKLAGRNLIPIPDLAAIEICDDKYLFYQTLKEKGFDRYLPRVGTQLPYPYILKKRIAEDGDNCYIIFNAADEKAHAAQLSDPEYFSQEIVAGHHEYATHILLKDGKIQSCINIKYTFAEELPIKGQNTYIAREISGCPYLGLFTQMLNATGFEGLCCVNYKVRDNQPFVFEINPRFGGSLSPFFFSFVRKLN